MSSRRRKGDRKSDKPGYNRKEWKKTVGYGGRRNVEIVVSAFKRIFSNSVSAVKMKNIVHEIKLKIAVYNRLLYMAQEAILRV